MDADGEPAGALPEPRGVLKALAAGRPDLWDSFRATYQESFPTVLRYVFSRVHDYGLAEDLVGDVFERALQAWPGFRQESMPSTWILGIARNVVSDYWRRGGRRSLSLETLPLSVQATSQDMPEEAAERNDDLARLAQALTRLSRDERDLLALRYAAGLPAKDIAALMDAREGTVRVRLHRTLRRLRAILLVEEADL